jgi:site-specific DNA recombinase
MTKRALLYSRVSTAEQAMPGKVSLETQVGDMERYCLEHGYEVVGRYQDVQSGADTKKARPEYERLLDAIRTKRGDVVVVWHPDRAVRGMIPAAAMQEALNAGNAVLEGVTAPVGQMLWLYAGVAGMERDRLVERTRMGVRGKAQRGEHIGGMTAFGYDYARETKRLVINPAEAEIVRRVYDLYLNEGLSLAKIARALNADGVPTKGTLGIAPAKQWRGYGGLRPKSNES